MSKFDAFLLLCAIPFGVLVLSYVFGTFYDFLRREYHYYKNRK